MFIRTKSQLYLTNWRFKHIFFSCKFQKLTHDNDITFDDSPLDGSEGQRFLHKRSADNDLDNDNDEGWLWTNVDRIKRSIQNVIEPNKRAKRGLFDSWFSTDTTTTEAPSTTPAPTTEQPEEPPYAFANQEQPTNYAPAELRNGDDDNANDDELDEEVGSGYEIENVDPQRGRFCKFNFFFK